MASLAHIMQSAFDDFKNATWLLHHYKLNKFGFSSQNVNKQLTKGKQIANKSLTKSKQIDDKCKQIAEKCKQTANKKINK